MAGTLDVNPDSTQNHDSIISNFYQLLLEDNPAMNWIQFGAPVAVDRLESFRFPEEVRTEIDIELNSDYATADVALTVVTPGGLNVQEGDYVRIEGHYDSTGVQIVLVVDGTPSATNIPIDSTPVQGVDTLLVEADQKITFQRGTRDDFEPVDAEFQGITEPALIKNNMQTFRKSFKVGENLQHTVDNKFVQGLENVPGGALGKAREEALHDMMFQHYRAFWDGVAKDAVTGGGADAGALMGGIRSFINTTTNTNRVDAGANPLVEDDINDLLELLVNKGLPEGEPLVILMNAANSRVLSALKADKITYNDPFNNAGSFGQAVQVYQGELPGFASLRIILDQQHPPFFAEVVSQNRVLWRSKLGNQIIEERDAKNNPSVLSERKMLYSRLSLSVVGRNNYNGVIWNIAP